MQALETSRSCDIAINLLAYLVENRVLSVLREAGRPVPIHSVLTGGQAFDDTQHGLAAILEVHPAPAVVWLNEYFGPVRRDVPCEQILSCHYSPSLKRSCRAQSRPAEPGIGVQWQATRPRKRTGMAAPGAL